mgnify:CR=1 FL=1
MPTRIDVAVSADAGSLALPLTPIRLLTAGTVVAQFAVSGLRQALVQCQEPAIEDTASGLRRIINAELRGRRRRREWHMGVIGARSRRRHGGRRSGARDQKPEPGFP